MTDNSILHESKHIEWSINNFFDEPDEVDYKLDSACVSLSDAKWFLRIWTNGETKYCSNGYVSLYLMKNESASEHDVTCRFGIKKKNGAEFRAHKFMHKFPKARNCGLGFTKFIERSKLLSVKEDVTVNGTLTVFFTFRIVDGLISSSASTESASQTRSNGTSTLIKDLQDMYLSSLQSDLIIAVKNKEFRAHSNILSCRSSVFKSMLLHDMMEKGSGRVEIPDGDPDTFQDFLLFLYTGALDNVSSQNAMSLYRYADKYDVQELKDECVCRMLDELSDDIFCDVLHLATMQNEQGLLKAVTDYFIKNAKTIVVSTQWMTFLQEHPKLGNELFLKQLNSKDCDCTEN